MCCRNGILIALALFLILFCDSTSSECTQLGPCICRLPDNSYYNLASLADKEPLTDDKFGLTVYFHPCKDISIPINSNLSNPCSNGNKVSLCMFDKKVNKIINLGTVNDTHMKLSNGNKFPVFEIHHNNVTSIINIVCVTNSDVDYFIIDQVSPDTETYNHFRLVSPYGCKKEPQRVLSTGSVLVILFFTFTGIYLIGGAVVLKTLRGATGWEMLPNHDFWCELPSLVRDGIVFTFNCCRANSYERI